VNENDHEGDLDFLWHLLELLPLQEVRCRHLSKGQPVVPLVHCTVRR
jgi:hypothetical protein